MVHIICWWSGGVTSAVACKKAIDLYGVENCRVIMIDTGNEDLDTYRFMGDCEKWYGVKIEVIRSHHYDKIQDVWYKYNSLNVAGGAVCSSELKKRVRVDWEKTNEFEHQVFGFEFEPKEFNRAISMVNAHPQAKPIFPLLQFGMTKKDCIKYVENSGIKIPNAYLMGFQNNNCLQTGCVQGGIGYWQKIKAEKPDLFDRMATVEHDLTNRRGEPVTMLKDQSKAAKLSGITLVFLKPHPNYPDHKCIDDMEGRPVEPLMDCNGFCGSNDMTPNPTMHELNYQDELFRKETPR